MKTQSIRVFDQKTFEKRVNQLEALVEELLKEEPSGPAVEKMMKELDIVYSEDPVERINRVLQALHPYQALEIEGV